MTSLPSSTLLSHTDYWLPQDASIQPLWICPNPHQQEWYCIYSFSSEKNHEWTKKIHWGACFEFQRKLSFVVYNFEFLLTNQDGKKLLFNLVPRLYETMCCLIALSQKRPFQKQQHDQGRLVNTLPVYESYPLSTITNLEQGALHTRTWQLQLIAYHGL